MHACRAFPRPLSAVLAAALLALASIASAARPPASPLTSDGAWRMVNPLQVYFPAVAYDAADDRLLCAGGSLAGGWALPLSAAPEWQELPSTPGQRWPGGRNWSTWDPGTRRMYFIDFDLMGLMAIGTYDPLTGAAGQLSVAGTPPDLRRMSIVMDPSRHRLILLGGDNSMSVVPSDQVWCIDLLPTPTWTQWSVSGSGPGPIHGADLFIDPVRDRLVAVAPYPGYGVPLGVYALSLDAAHTWTPLTAQNPPGDFINNGLAYDGPGDRILTMNGGGSIVSFSLATNAWSVDPALTPGPSPRTAAGLVLDTARHRLLVTGGQMADGSGVCNDTWALPLDGAPAWTAIVPAVQNPSTRDQACSAYDASRNRMLFFGGVDNYNSVKNDTWALAMNGEPAWSPVAAAGTPPPARQTAACAYDPQRDQFVLFGGSSPNAGILGDLWTLSFAGGTPTWTQLTPSGLAPPARHWATMVYDSSRDRFLLFFGEGGTGLLSDTWELKLAPAIAWRQLNLLNTSPGPRMGASAVYDPIRDHVLLTGGYGAGDIAGALWTLDFTVGDGKWSKFGQPSGPAVRYGAVTAIDTQRQRLLLIGGRGAEFYSDVWALPLAGSPHWTQLAPTGYSPGGRDIPNGAYDMVNDRMLFTSGATSGSNDTWALEFGDVSTPTELALESSDVTSDRAVLVWSGAMPGAVVTAYRRAPEGEWQRVATLDADGEGRVRLEDASVTPGTTLEYRLGVPAAAGEAFFGAVTVRIPTVSLTLSLAAAAADRGVAFAIQLPSGAPASLALYDVAGRRVWSRDVGALGAGAHTVTETNANLAPALYFARLTQAGLSRHARLVLVR